MTTAPRDAVSIAPVRSGEPPWFAGGLSALLLASLVFGASTGAYARFGQLAPFASCVAADAPLGLLTRALAAGFGLLPLAALGARGEAGSALLAGLLALLLHAASVRVLARVRAVSVRRREPLAFGSALTLTWLLSAQLHAVNAVATVLLALCVERTLARLLPSQLNRAPRRRRNAQLVLAFALLACERAPTALSSEPLLVAGSVTATTGVAPARDSDGSELDDLLDAAARELPPRALLIAGLAARRTLCTAQHEAQLRPDLALLPPPRQLDARTALALERRDPSLRPLLRAQLLDPTPAWPELQALAARRPVLLEPDPELPKAAARTLLPAGLWQQLSTGEVGKTDLRLSATSADHTLQRLAARLDPLRAEPALRSWLASTVRSHAAHEAAYGDAARSARLVALSSSWAPPAADAPFP